MKGRRGGGGGGTTGEMPNRKGTNCRASHCQNLPISFVIFFEPYVGTARSIVLCSFFVVNTPICTLQSTMHKSSQAIDGCKVLQAPQPKAPTAFAKPLWSMLSLLLVGSPKSDAPFAIKTAREAATRSTQPADHCTRRRLRTARSSTNLWGTFRF